MTPQLKQVNTLGLDLTQKIYENVTTAPYRQNNPPASANISSGIMFITVHTSSYAMNPLGKGLQNPYNSNGRHEQDLSPIGMTDFVFLIIFHVIHNPKSYQQKLKDINTHD